MGKEIRIIKKGDLKKFEDYTFVDDNNNSIELKKIGNENDSNYPSSSSSSNDKKNRREDVFKLRSNPKKDMRARNKSRLVGGRGTQSHSPVYE